MALPPGLTDITIHFQTPGEKAAMDRAVQDRRWSEVDDLKSAVVLHFGSRQVRFSTSTRAIDQARRALSDLTFPDLLVPPSPAPVIKPVGERRTAWEHLTALSDED